MIGGRGKWMTIGALVTGVTASLLIAGPAQAAIEPVGLPPTPDELVSATNAMLSFELDPVLAAGAKDGFSTGYTNPPGGQDPLPVCVYGPRYRTVAIPRNDATGFSAQNGFVTQSVYAYPTEVAFAGAWLGLDAAIVKHCSGSFVEDGVKTTVRSMRIPASGEAGAGWAVTTASKGSVIYMVVMPVRGSIQAVSYVRQVSALPAGVASAVQSLSSHLAERWAMQATLPNTQGPLLTGAQQSMLTPADVPAELPVTTPKNGGWSSFSASTSGLYLLPCNEKRDIPTGSWTFSSSLGGWGDVTAEPGQLFQSVDVYQSNDEAAAIWARIKGNVLGCPNFRHPAIDSGKSIQWVTTGTSAMTYGGVPGVWSRQLMTYPGSDGGFTTKVYDLYLLVDNTIQNYSYYLSRDGISQLPLDQAAVNELAQSLVDRWVAAQSAS